MASTRLTTVSRSRVLTAALDHRFKRQEQKLREAEDKLAHAVITCALGKSAMEQINALPDGWMPVVCRVYVTCAGETTRLDFVHACRAPQNFSSYIKDGTLPQRLRLRIARHAGERERLERDREDLKRELRTALNSFGTLESLLKLWPEMEPFTKGIERAASQLPAVPIAHINQSLGIAA